ncbi:axonemal dynein light chain domain-containing protein 1 isoform X2 [Pygocentrus nattereri]|uniref:Axonemal dynein light chain domain containing 1 n=1 Tax=Pygocentrus nattereri TaxID=42514 RepID=A0A3B4EC19_PYGNA|nr:axonemal dynein light chain domain-containing protein 1 isoform X2 [Pygocentrus nattereri]
MASSLKSSPSPPALPKPESRRRRLNASVEERVGAAELPELLEVKEISPLSDQAQVQILPLQNDLVPDELLTTLTSAICTQGRLGPPRLNKTPKHLKVCGVRAPDPVWHHSFGRKKYQYFLDQPTSVTGAGRDISFLCDALAAQKQRMPLPPMTDRSTTQSIDIQKDTLSMETLIPAEYHIVKHKGLKGLQCYDDKFTVLLEDDKKKLKVFPSMKPSGRLEAVQLMRVMDDMLEKAGVNQEFEELTGLSQMQGLLELVRVEQNIYNIVFHELIRQVSVECAERGQLLAKLRRRYVALLDRVPRQLKGLHTETLAQRALNRRLTEEVICFRHSITQLNEELSKMRECDEHVSMQARRAQEELAKALEQSQRNSDLVGEYHDLYEMQRRRLEGQVATLTEERDLWSKVTYSLALKVIKLNNLQLVSRLHVSEQTWSKTAEHFTVFLTTKDSEDMNHVMQLTEQWTENLTSFMEKLRETERKQCKNLGSIQNDIVKWHKFCEANNRCSDVKFEKTSEEELFRDLMQWSTVLTMECERYGGEDLLSGQETLNTLTQLQEEWIEVCLQLFRRHPTPDGEPLQGQEAMRELSGAITELHKQLSTRINGESGIHQQMMSLSGEMDLWANKLKSIISRPDVLPHSDWSKLEKTMGSWVKLSEEALLNVDSTQSESKKIKRMLHIRIEIDDVFSTLREFILAQNNFFDYENLTLCEEVSSMHTLLTRWMVDLLLQMVPDRVDDQEPPFPENTELSILKDLSLKKLEEDAKSLSQKLHYFSKYITGSCQTIVEEQVQKSLSQDEKENELYQLSKLQRECAEWVEVCQILLSDMMGRPVELQWEGKAVPQSVTDIPSTMASMDSLVGEHTKPELPAEGEKHEQEVQEAIKADSRPHPSEEPDEQVEEEKTEEVTDEGAALKLIGHDGHIIEQNLGKETVDLTGTSNLVGRPHTENAQQAFSALATVGVLQQELLAVEARAISAEERALNAEEALQAALEKIQVLERQIHQKPSPESSASKKSVTPVAKTAVTPEPKEGVFYLKPIDRCDRLQRPPRTRRISS